MKRTAAAVLLLTTLASGASLAVVTAAEAATLLFLPTAEAWYQSDPTCALPTGCLETGLPPAPTLPDPPAVLPIDIPQLQDPETIQIGEAAGQETSRAYLGFPFAAVQGAITSAELEIPLDVGASQTPDLANLAVCPVSVLIVEARGSDDVPPEAPCETFAIATYVEEPLPHLIVDLAPILTSLPAATGVALIPAVVDPTSGETPGTWRVVFSSSDRTGDDISEPATLSLVTEDAAVAAPTTAPLVATPAPAPDPDPTTAPAPAPVAPQVVASVPRPVPVRPVIRTSTVTTPAVEAAPQVAAPAVVATAAPQVPPVETVAAPVTTVVSFEYAYRGVWLMPLVLLLFVTVVVRVLTRDLAPVVVPSSSSSSRSTP